MCWATKRSLNSLSTVFSLAFSLIVQSFLLANLLEQRGLRGVEKTIQLRFERADLLHGQIVQHAVGARVDDHHLLFHRDRLVLRLLQNFDQPFAATQLLLRSLVQLGAEQRECRQLAILRQIQTQAIRPPAAWP